MSFGFSVGDFLSVGALIANIIGSLKSTGGAVSEYQELVRELHGLQRTLDIIEHLKGTPHQETTINGLKVAALNCQFVLDEFAATLRKYEASLEPGRSRGKFMDATAKIRWTLTMKKDVQDLRGYLAGHTNSLNMRLSIAGLSTCMTQAEIASNHQIVVVQKLESTQATLLDVKAGSDELRITQQNSLSILQRVLRLITGDVLPQLGSLMDIATKIWHSNMQIINFMVQIQATGPTLDYRYMWVQEPVKFEDALGRILPIPSEYNWEKLEAIILAQFSAGPGHGKVFSGEYELFSSTENETALSRDTFTNASLIPGMSITMAIIIGSYGQLSRCPRTNCKSQSLVDAPMGGKSCPLCNTWSRPSQKELPRPLKPPIFPNFYEEIANDAHPSSQRRPSWLSVSNDSLVKLRNERRSFKNVCICITELPATPSFTCLEQTSDFRIIPEISGRLVTQVDKPTERQPPHSPYPMPLRSAALPRSAGSRALRFSRTQSFSNAEKSQRFAIKVNIPKEFRRKSGPDTYAKSRARCQNVHNVNNVYTECGRHGDEWLFGGFSKFSLTKFIKKML